LDFADASVVVLAMRADVREILTADGATLQSTHT
jgi:predicted nucleic acid-binding protein